VFERWFAEARMQARDATSTGGGKNFTHPKRLASRKRKGHVVTQNKREGS